MWSKEDLTDEEYAELSESERNQGPDPRDYDDDEEYDEVWQKWDSERAFG